MSVPDNTIARQEAVLPGAANSTLKLLEPECKVAAENE